MIKNRKLSEVLKSIEEKEEISDFLFVYSGNLNQDVIATAVKLIERKLKMQDYAAGLITRAKIITTEILQNITRHQLPDPQMLPYYFLASSENGLIIFAGNVISDTGKEYMEQKLDLFKSYDASQMRTIYLNALSKSVVNENGNAGLGLLDIAYRSGQKYDYAFEQLSSSGYAFDFNVWINKH
jgi:hypothetical protein